MSQLHELRLHEKINNVDNDNSFMAVRVPGGWIYRFFERHQGTGSFVVDSVFVPFSNEFNVDAVIDSCVQP